MLRWRRKVKKRGAGKIEKIEDYVNFFKTPQGQSLLNYDETAERHLCYELVRDRGEKHLILYDKELLLELEDATDFHVDSTFKSRPCMRDITQLLTIMAEAYGRVSICKI